MTTRLSYLLNPFLLATALANEISSFLYINQLGSVSTSFWRYPLKSVRRKALRWISYFTPSSSSVPPNIFSSILIIFNLPFLMQAVLSTTLTRGKEEQFPGRAVTMGAPNDYRVAEKSQRCHKHFFQYTTFTSKISQVGTWRRQTCFLPRAPSNLVTPLTLTPLLPLQLRFERI